MAYARRTDTTHEDIRDGIRKVYGKHTVMDTHNLGEGFPDLVFGVHHRTFLIEAKTNQNRTRGVRFRKSATNARQAVLRSLWIGDDWIITHSAEDCLAQISKALIRGY